MFKQEDLGFGAAQEPSGYIRIETREGKGKASVLVQNLKDGKGEINYKVYILKIDENKVVPVALGPITLQKGKGELQWEFKPDDVGLTGSSIDGFNTAVILAEYKEKKNVNIMCPLAAYKDKKLPWKEMLKGILYAKPQANAPNENPVKKQEVESKYPGKIESIYHKEKAAQEEGGQNEGYFQGNEAGNGNPENMAEAALENSYPENMAGYDPDNANGEAVENNAPAQDNENFSLMDEYKGLFDKEASGFADGLNQENKELENLLYNQNSHLNPVESNKPAEKRKQDAGDMERLKAEMDRSFEFYDPFRSRRRDYRWWKINSPVHLNNVLYQCSIKTPVLFNPKILMAHFKYRHLILGIYTDRARRREYIVFGVPGVYNVDERPFGEMCRWAQVEGNRPRYGAFGYWLVYIDPRTGKIV